MEYHGAGETKGEERGDEERGDEERGDEERGDEERGDEERGDEDDKEDELPPPPYEWDWDWDEADGGLGEDIATMRQLAGIILDAYGAVERAAASSGPPTRDGYGLAAHAEISALKRPEHARALRRMYAVGCEDRVFSACTSRYLRKLRLLREKIDGEFSGDRARR